jgi:hypothetical protein
MFNVTSTPEEKADIFGGVYASQDIVIALLQGREEDLSEARQLSLDMFNPVNQCHRITVAQMAILEPAAAEVVVAMCATVMREAIEESIRRGVPAAAARAFLLGHMQLALGIALNSDIPFSEACKIAVDYGRQHVLQEDWKKVFEPDSIQEVFKAMLHLDP